MIDLLIMSLLTVVAIVSGYMLCLNFIRWLLVPLQGDE